MRNLRVGIVLKSYLGDAVMALPLLKGLCEEFGEINVLVAGPARFVVGHLEGVRLFSEKTDFQKTADWYSQFYKESNPDAVVLVNRSFRSAFSAWKARVPVRIGHATEGRGWLLTDRFSYRKTDYEAKSYFDLGAALGIEPDLLPLDISLPLPKEASLVSSNQPYAVIQPGARYPEKQIILPHLCAIASQIHARGFKMVMVGDQSECNAGLTLEAKCGLEFQNLIGKTSLDQLAQVLSGTAVTVASDTGISHLSASLGTPTLTLFGPNSSLKWGHPLPHCRSVQSPTRKMQDLPLDSILSGLEELLRLDQTKNLRPTNPLLITVP